MKIKKFNESIGEKTYIAYLEQDGGCDYTIGCGKLVIDLAADNMEEAIEIIKEIIESDYNYPEAKLSSCKIFEVLDISEINVDILYGELQEKKNQKRLKEKEEKERIKYEELRKKYGN